MGNEVEEIKQRLDLVGLVGQYVTLKKAGANYKATCPFHQEKTASLMVSPEKQIWKCFGCGRGGDHYKFVMEAEHLEFGDALKLLAQKAGVTLQPKSQAEYQTRDRKETLFRLNKLAASVFHKILTEKDAGKTALEYLKKRTIKPETIKEFQIGFAPKNLNLKDFLLKREFLAGDLAKAGAPERFYERIMFPIYDVLGNVVGFTGRSLGESQPKYLNSAETPIFNKSRVLYGLNLAKGEIKEKNYVVLVEGQMDVVALYQAGVTNTVASSGTAITETQLVTLSKYTPNFLLAFDNDEAGLQTTKKVIELLLKLDLNSKVVDFGQFKDAGELFEKKPAAWKEAVKVAKEGVDWWIDHEISRAGPLQFIENKKKVIKAMLPIISLVSEPTRLDHYAQRLSLAVGVKNESIYAALDRVGQSKPAVQAPKGELPQLTNEEQLLALAIARPDLMAKKNKEFEQIVWQSGNTSTVAEQVRKLYNNLTLTADSAKFLTTLKTNVDADTAGKLDSWQFWLSNQWPELTDEVASELIDEKLGRVITKQYEQKKESVAREIKQAQEKGDIAKVKTLMNELNKLTAKN